jgi:hypothetical protein
MSRSDAAAAVVGIDMLLKLETYSCKVSAVRPCNWHEIDTWWHLNTVVVRVWSVHLSMKLSGRKSTK